MALVNCFNNNMRVMMQVCLVEKKFPWNCQHHRLQALWNFFFKRWEICAYE